MLCPHLEVNLDVGPGKASWDKAIQIFRYHKSNIASAEKGIVILEKFRDGIEKRLISRNRQLSLRLHIAVHLTNRHASYIARCYC
jgi:hypothetical protein